MNVHLRYGVALLALASLFVISKCSTAPVVSKPVSLTDAKENIRGSVYALPRTMVTVTARFEYHVLPAEQASPNQPAPRARVKVELASTADALKIEPSHIPDYNWLFQLTPGEDLVTEVTRFEVGYGTTGLLTSFNGDFSDKSAQVISNTIGVVATIAKGTAGLVSSDYVDSGVSFTLVATVPASKFLAEESPLFAAEMKAIKENKRPDVALSAQLREYDVTTVPSLTIGLAPDELVPALPARARLESAPGIYYAIPINRVALIRNGGQDVVATQALVVTDGAPIALLPMPGQRFAKRTYKAEFKDNGSLSKFEHTRDSAAEKASDSLKVSAESIQKLLDSLKKPAADTGTGDTLTNRRAFALEQLKGLKRLDRADLLKEKADLEKATAAPSLPTDARAIQTNRLKDVRRSIARLDAELAALEAGVP